MIGLLQCLSMLTDQTFEVFCNWQKFATFSCLSPFHFCLCLSSSFFLFFLSLICIYCHPRWIFIYQIDAFFVEQTVSLSETIVRMTQVATQSKLFGHTARGLRRLGTLPIFTQLVICYHDFFRIGPYIPLSPVVPTYSHPIQLSAPLHQIGGIRVIWYAEEIHIRQCSKL